MNSFTSMKETLPFLLPSQWEESSEEKEQIVSGV